MDIITAWMVALIVSVAPASNHTRIEAARETKEETAVRYGEIAEDLISVVYDEKEQPLFRGPQGRAKTAAVILAIARYESDFRRDVDFGEGPRARGDGGKSWCLGQINLGEPNKVGDTPRRIGVDQAGYFRWSERGQGFSGPDLVQDRRNCFRAMLWVARTSFAICGHVYKKQPEFWLNLYVASNCMRGYESSEKRMTLAKRWAQKKMPGVEDKVVMNQISQKQIGHATASPPLTRLSLIASAH